ncbi:DUF4381 domain-containing protein [Dyella sp. 20L07]|uniref:DUF4381 domain-containing protein n=1 Tax=Dyella sp. 20L07 TaxID=3384240 RepID=UPI003D292D82
MFLLPAKMPAASIDQLKDIPLPPPVSWAPQTTGWWVVGAMLLAGMLWIAVRRWRIWWHNRFRRAAQAELVLIEHAVADPAKRVQALAALPSLVKRTVLTWAPRDQIGPMTGEAWLGFLDSTFTGSTFSQGVGKHLESLAYGNGDIGHEDLGVLLALLHRWIDGHAPA